MNTRAKFKCSSVTKSLHWDKSKGNLFAATLNPVTADNEENKKFFEATPAGQIQLSTIRDDHFEVGKDYYVDFTLAE